MKVLEQLLESVRKSNPGLISEEQCVNMINDFNKEIDTLKTDAYQAGQAQGFKDGYDEGKAVTAAEAKAKFDDLVEQLDAEATEKLVQVIDQIDINHTEKLQALLDWVKENMVSRDQIDQALQKQDEEYAAKFDQAMTQVDTQHAAQLQQVYEAIDAKHAKMIEEAVNKVDSACAKKLQKVATILEERKEKAVKAAIRKTLCESRRAAKKQQLVYESKIAAGKKALKDEQDRKVILLAESVQKYLNYALETSLPKRQLISEAKYNSATRAIEKITDILKVNSVIQESKENLFADYEAKISSEKEAQEKLLNENIELKTQINKIEARLVLEEKCKSCTPSEAKFLKAYFAKAETPAVIEESISEAKAAYKKLQSDRRESLIAESSKKINSLPTAVVTEKQIEDAKAKAKAKIVSESKAAIVTNVKTTEPIVESATPEESLIDMYAKALTKYEA